MISKERLVNELKRLKKRFNNIPSYNINNKYGKYDSDTYRRRFGSWNAALLFTFGEIVKEKPVPRPIVLCKNCGRKTKNLVFCSKSCSASFHNKRSPKRQKTALCIYCGEHTKSSPRSGERKCRSCFRSINVVKFGEEKIIKDFSSTYARHKHQGIRNHAHRVANISNLIKKCSACGYDKTVDLCHKQSIASFSKDTQLSVVNHIDNLVYLCPNHHWELDHGLLQCEI